MIGNVGKLWVGVGLKDSDLKRGVKANERLLAGFGRRLGLLGVAAGGAAAAGLAVLTREGLANIDTMAKLARDLHTTTASMQVMERAGELAGTSFGAIETATRSLSLRLGQAAEGAGPAVTALQRLGLTADELIAMPLDQRISEINSRISEFVPLAAQAAVAGQLFGERGALAMARLDSDVLAQATSDVQRFGVAVSDVDAAQIEVTNDALSRLSLIGQGLGNQVAVSIAPALERMANWMAAISEIGGPLNQVITVIAGNLDRLAVYVGVAATAIGVRYVGAVALAAVRTASLSGALTFLRGAILRTGFGVLIIGAGELVLWFNRLVERVGGFGNALVLLKGVAVETFGRIGTAFSIVPAAIRVGSAAMNRYFLTKLFTMSKSFSDFTQGVADGLNSLFGTNLQGAGAGITAGLAQAAGESVAAVANASGEIARIRGALTAPLSSVQALRDAMTETTKETAAATDATSDYAAAVEGLGGGASGVSGSGGAAGGGGAASAVAAVTDEVAGLGQKTDVVKNTMQSAFVGLVTGAKSLSASIKDVLSSFANMFANRAFETLWGGGVTGGGIGSFVSGISSKFAGFFDQGGTIPSGMFGVAGEFGPEIVEGPARVTSRSDTARLFSGDTYNIDARYSKDPAATADAVRRAIEDATPGIQAGAVQKVRRNIQQDRGFLGA